MAGWASLTKSRVIVQTGASRRSATILHTPSFMNLVVAFAPSALPLAARNRQRARGAGH
jgi:hypothetical protein